MYHVKWSHLGPFHKYVILCYVFGIEIGEHKPVNCGVAAGHTEAVFEKTANFLRNGTQIILMKDTQESR